MKKILFFLSFCSLLFSACSSDEDNAPEVLNTNGTLIKRIIISSDNFNYTANFFYSSGNRIARQEGVEIRNGAVANQAIGYYTYTGNLITRMDVHRNNALTQTSSYNYNSSGNMISKLLLNYSSNTAYRVTYEYLADGNIEIFAYRGDFSNQTTEDLHKKVFMVNGKVDKMETYKMISGVLETLTTDYTFDEKHDPQSSILGFDKLISFESGAYQVPNNITSITYSATNGTQTDVDEMTYTYNLFGFPISSRVIDPSDNGGSDEFCQYYYY